MMSRQAKTMALMAAVIIIQTCCIIALAAEATSLPSRHTATFERQFEECMTGWRGTLDTLKSLNATILGDKR